jgi:ribosome-associated translation inhibitor RaiA
MTTLYSIHAYDQESKYYHGEDRINDGKLYATFDNACEVIERKIQAHIEHFNSEEEEEVFRAPNREEMERKISKGKFVHYYETSVLWLWVISKWEVVVEEKPKKYVYQYWVENKICGLHTNSDKYASFDEVCDALDMELRQLYEVYGGEKPFEPLQSREEVKTLIETCPTIVYAYVNDGSGSMNDKYVLNRQDA